MATLYFYPSGASTASYFAGSTTKYTTPSLCYYDGATKYIPLITKTGSVDIGNYRYTYDSSGAKTIHCYYNNTEYVVPNTQTPISAYNIPAGTYTPSAFENLIKNYISTNGSRTVKNAFTVTVNGQTISVSAGATVYYTQQSSSPLGFIRSVGFGPFTSGGTQPILADSSPSNGFSSGRRYIVYNAGGGYAYTVAFAGYANYNITVGTGINFN